MSLSKRAIKMYKTTQKVARHIVDDKTQIEYAFIFCVEDQKYGKDKVGTDTITCKVTMKISEKKTVYLMLPRSVESEVALAGGNVEALRCQLQIKLPEHHQTCECTRMFQSRPFVRSADDENVYVVTIDDTTPCEVESATEHLETRRQWTFEVRSRPKKPLIIESLVFTHDPATHTDLMTELCEEAVRHEYWTAQKLVDLCRGKRPRDEEDGEMFVGSGVKLSNASDSASEQK